MNNRVKIAYDFAKSINCEYINQIILFGSVARGEDTPDSDIDILIITNHRDKIWPKISNLMGKTVLEYGELITAHIMSEDRFKTTQNYSFLSNVLKDGVRIG